MPFGGCAALIHPTLGDANHVFRWMRCAYPPYAWRREPCLSVDALCLSTLRLTTRAISSGGCAALIHPTLDDMIHAFWWMRCAYPPYAWRHEPCLLVDALRLSTLRLTTRIISSGGCATLIHPTPDHRSSANHV